MRRPLAGRMLAATLLLAPFPALARGQDESYKPNIDVASPDVAQASKSFRLAPGLKVELFAAEPLLANPVAFCIDERGRFFVAETFRHHAGVTDNRNHMNWLDADMACRTVDDRVAMYRKYLGESGFAKFNTEHERVRLVEDRDGDGKADHASVFADGFKNAPDGIGAGLLARKGDVYFTCIPDVWKLRDADGDGHAEVKDSLSHGYGVHVAFLGHDLHGLKMGPDGRLYFSIGDRGLNVVNKEGKRLVAPDTGSVLRCEPDGSNLEIFATGLRNPQELAFDDHGNLFTGDNNSDGGDAARWVYVVEGGDSGWRMGYQYLDFPTSRGPWNAEKLWHLRWEGQAAYVLPPLAHIANGPSGLTHDPGTGLPAKYRGHFFLADFGGTNTRSGIRSFANKPKGAAFELIEPEQFAWSVLATDVDFGPDGSVYLTDWINGWEKPGKGRIWKISSEEVDPRAAEVKTLIAEGMAKRPLDQLAKLLGHADQRVRLEAQYELAARAIAEVKDDDGARGAYLALLKATSSGPTLLSRLHAIWGIGQVGRKVEKGESVPTSLLKLMTDPEPEVRAQAAKTYSELPKGIETTPILGESVELLNQLLGDTGPRGRFFPGDAIPRVRFFAALALGHHGKPGSVPALFGMLRDNADKDAYLRHAAVMGLAGIGDVEALAKAASDPSPSVRLGAVLALRRLARPEAAQFLSDADPKVATEAGIAIYEAPIDPALPDLAAIAGKEGLPEALARRAINAANRVGRAADASALATVAGRSKASAKLRVEALSILSTWARPPGRDRINGLWRPIDERSSKVAADALRPSAGSLIAEAPDEVRVAAIKAVAELGIAEAGPALVALLAENRGNVASRAEALKALDRLAAPNLADAVASAIASKDGPVRSEGLRVLARLSPEKAVPALAKVIESGPIAEKQKALEVLGDSGRPEADAILLRALDRQAAKPELGIELELIDAASKRKSPEVRDRLARLESERPKTGPLAEYRGALEGGDSARGRKIFQDNAAVYCVRCHKVKGEGGEVGPELSGVAARHPRDYLLESIVDPNKAIALGFESVVVAKSDGQVIVGVFKSEDDRTLRLMTAEAKLIEVPKSEIEDRKRGASAMPEDLARKLSKAEVRDLVEFLASLK